MKCTKCGAVPVSGKIMIQNENGSEELNLCDRCLHEFIKEHPEVMNGADLSQMLRFFVTALGGLQAQAVAARINPEENSIAQSKIVCPTCKLSLKELRGSRRAGCGTCYSFFKEEIDRFLLSHCGENSQTRQQLSRENRAQQLHLELKKAIQLEKFELAARIRDDLKKLQK